MNQHPWIIAHRGDVERYTENTLPAFCSALERGADGIELDVQFTAEGTPVVFHDRDLRRITGQRGNLADLEDKALDTLGLRPGPDQAGFHLPTLREACECLAHARVPIFVEIKTDALPHHRVSTAVVDVLRQSEAIAGHRVLISFSEAALRIARSYARVPVGWVLEGWDIASRERAEALQPDWLFCDITLLPPGTAPLWTGPWDWAVYEINETGPAEALARRGVKAIETGRLSVWR
ncbi:glycerophosphodiester phosphodiesterase family protein [Alkalilimnicola ehrlichii]|uniref:glycerophosphodiester phosphodiesterase family protein n=1 Tax=Alkalilimnicola ehrlichii TaxID=351052 RepID=UPI003B9FE4F3